MLLEVQKIAYRGTQETVIRLLISLKLGS